MTEYQRHRRAKEDIMLLICLQLFTTLIVLVQGQVPSDCTTPNGEKARCVPLRSCPILKNALLSDNTSSEKFVEASACNNTNKLSVCCGSVASFNTSYNNQLTTPSTVTSIPLDKEAKQKLRREYVKNKLLGSKKYCGQQHWDDFFHTPAEEESTEASVSEFPWMIIVDSTRRSSNESKIMVGVHHIKKNISCVPTPYVEDCTEGTQEVQSEKVYNVGRRIVLARLTREVQYSESVRPICLPFLDNEKPKENEIVFTSGWGEALSVNSEDYVKIKKRSKQVVVDNANCYSKFIPKFPEDMCLAAPPNSSVTTCWGDEGGPVMFRKGLNWFASGIVNSASDCSLEDSTSATRFTPAMVDRILDYIFEDYCVEHTHSLCP